eukprot:5529981-Pleurochrysis_carterae.AAC.2
MRTGPRKEPVRGQGPRWGAQVAAPTVATAREGAPARTATTEVTTPAAAAAAQTAPVTTAATALSALPATPAPTATGTTTARERHGRRACSSHSPATARHDPPSHRIKATAAE